jgi:hypothetical protein
MMNVERSVPMKCILIAFASLLFVALSCKNVPSNASVNGTPNVSAEGMNQSASAAIDLTTIKRIESKGRVQDHDYNEIPVVDQLIALGPACIPLLIQGLEDQTVVVGRGMSGNESDRPVIAFWSETTVGDLALVILTDLFTDSTWEKTTIPGVGWNEFLDRKDKNLTGEQVLREFIEKHGRKGLKAKWHKIWELNRDKIYWDKTERCFKVRK